MCIECEQNKNVIDYIKQVVMFVFNIDFCKGISSLRPGHTEGTHGERMASALEICNLGQCVVVRPTFVVATAS